MSECYLPRIEFSLFWKISATILATMNVRIVFRFKDTIDKKKNELRSKIRYDGETKIPIRLPTSDQKFLDYDFNKLLIRLWICPLVSGLFVFIYLICKDVDPIFQSVIYDCILNIVSYLGLFPVAYTYGIIFWIGALYLKTS